MPDDLLQRHVCRQVLLGALARLRVGRPAITPEVLVEPQCVPEEESSILGRVGAGRIARDTLFAYPDALPSLTSILPLDHSCRSTENRARKPGCRAERCSISITACRGGR